MKERIALTLFVVWSSLFVLCVGLDMCELVAEEMTISHWLVIITVFGLFGLALFSACWYEEQ